MAQGCGHVGVGGEEVVLSFKFSTYGQARAFFDEVACVATSMCIRDCGAGTLVHVQTEKLYRDIVEHHADTLAGVGVPVYWNSSGRLVDGS